MALSVDVVEVQGKTYPAIGGVTGAAFTAALARITTAEADIAVLEAIDADARLDELEPNSVFFRANSQDAADTTSTTSTTVYSVALAFTVTIPNTAANNWTLRCVAALDMKHSASGSSHMRVSIAGNNGTAISATLTSSEYRTIRVTHTVTGVAGGVKTIEIQFKSNGAGTTTVDNPSYVFYALP